MTGFIMVFQCRHCNTTQLVKNENRQRADREALIFEHPEQPVRVLVSEVPFILLLRRACSLPAKELVKKKPTSPW
jgi:hypothetical protein